MNELNELLRALPAIIWFALLATFPIMIAFMMWEDVKESLAGRRMSPHEKRGLYALAQKHAYYRGVRVTQLEHLVEDHGAYKLPTKEGQFVRDRLQAFVDKQLAKPYDERPKGRQVWSFVPYKPQLRTP